MGSAQSTEKKSVRLVDDFDTLLGRVTDVGSIMVINGFDFTHVYNIKPGHNLVQQLSISPRIYPVELAAQSGERIIPGSYSAIFVGSVSDMEYRVAFPLFDKPNAQLTVPLTDYCKTSLYVQPSLNPDITGYLRYRDPRIATEFAFSASDYFTKGNVIVNFASEFKNTTYGALLSKTLFKSGYTFRVGVSTKFGKFESGTFISLDPQLHINKSLRYKPNEDTEGGLHIELYPSDLRTKTAFFIERNFSMSVFAFNITSTGSCSSCIKRRLGQHQSMQITSSADLFKKVYQFGLGLVFE